MKAFIPYNFNLILLVIGLLAFIIGIGYKLIKSANYKLVITLSWLLVIALLIITERATLNEAPGFRMLTIILVTLFAMKIPVTIEAYRNSENKLGFSQWTAFVAGWFGMRPKLFEHFGGVALEGVEPLVRKGIGRVLIGILLLVVAKLLSIYINTFIVKIIISAMLLAGLSFILHFGILTISAGMWRKSGVDTRILFREPFVSTSLTEFWGRRWNIAFSEMTSLAIYRPLKKPIGIGWATIIAFLFSGLLHEIAISFPVQAGFGFPLLYFAIQGIIMLAEKELEKRKIPVYRNKFYGRVWTLFWLILPMPLLFHKAFLKGIIWPLIGMN